MNLILSYIFLLLCSLLFIPLKVNASPAFLLKVYCIPVKVAIKKCGSIHYICSFSVFVNEFIFFLNETTQNNDVRISLGINRDLIKVST